MPHRGGGRSGPVGAPDRRGRRRRATVRTALRRPSAASDAPARASSRAGARADDARQIVFEVPAQVVDQPVDVGRERGVAGDLDVRPLAGQRLRQRQRRVRRVDGDAQVGARSAASVPQPLDQPGRRDAKRNGRQRRQQRRPAVEAQAACIVPACALQPLDRRPARPRHVVDQQRQALQHRAVRAACCRALKHARIVGSRSLMRHPRRGRPHVSAAECARPVASATGHSGCLSRARTPEARGRSRRRSAATRPSGTPTPCLKTAPTRERSTARRSR